MSRLRLWATTIAGVGAIAVSSLTGVPTAAAAPAPTALPKIPVVYVSGSNEIRPTAELAAAGLRNAGFDTHIFLTWEPDDPRTSPYVTVKGNSARLPAFVDRVRRVTGSDKVDIVTYSQGGLVTRYWLKDFGGARYARTVVSLSGLIKGSPFQAQALREGQCPPAGYEALVPPGYAQNPTDACLEMAYGGKSVTALNSPTEALPGIRYYNITSRQETDAAPYPINLMSGPGDYQNIVTQDHCPRDPVYHLTMAVTPSVQSAVASALRGGPVRFRCMF